MSLTSYRTALSRVTMGVAHKNHALRKQKNGHWGRVLQPTKGRPKPQKGLKL